MDNARLVTVLGREPHTPLDEAVEVTLLGLGCIATPTVLEPHRHGQSHSQPCFS
jgi:hypothetical protein